MNDCSHEEAALTLKGAGSTVTLLLEYRPSEFDAFQKKLQEVRTPVEPSTSPGIKPPPVKQLYVRCNNNEVME